MNNFQPKRLKIMEKGLMNYSGYIGAVEFKDGVSVNLVGMIESNIIGANLLVVDAADETYQISPVSNLQRMRDVPADDYRVKAVDVGTMNENGEIKLAIEKFSREELEKIADTRGLTGVREIANKLGRTGRSIEDCIRSILEEQGDFTVPGAGEK